MPSPGGFGTLTQVRIQLIVNPFASSVTPRARVVLEQALSAHHDVSIVETKRRGHATKLAQFAASDGVDIVAVLGGDGTQNEVANGLVDTETALATLLAEAKKAKAFVDELIAG